MIISKTANEFFVLLIIPKVIGFKAEEFLNILLEIDGGTLKDDKIHIPENLSEVVKYLKTLSDKIYPDPANSMGFQVPSL